MPRVTTVASPPPHGWGLCVFSQRKTRTLDHGRVPPQPTAQSRVRCGAPGCIRLLAFCARLSSPGCFLCAGKELLFPFIAFLSV